MNIAQKLRNFIKIFMKALSRAGKHHKLHIS